MPVEEKPPVMGDGSNVVGMEARLQQLEAELAKAKTTIHDLNDESAARRVALRKSQEEKEQIETARLTEQGQWKELAEKRLAELEALKPYQEKYAAVQQTIQQSNERRLATIPEDKRIWLPEGYTPEQLSQWLDARMHLLTAPAAPDLDGGAGRGGGGNGKSIIQLTLEEKDVARKSGMTEEEYARYAKRG